MRRKHANLIGNSLMILGLVVMVAGVGHSVLNQLPRVVVHGAIFSIFVGALMWLVGAGISGREKITDRYYWVRHYGDKRCRQTFNTRHHS